MTLPVRLPEGVGLVADDDPSLTRALSLLEQVLDRAPEPSFPIHVHLGVADTSLAIAQVQSRPSRPGEVVMLVSTGVLERLGDREVLSVLAHELGHVQNRHLRANRDLVPAWLVGIGVAALTLVLAREAEGVMWWAMAAGVVAMLALRPWIQGVIHGLDELEADRFSAELFGVRQAVRTLYQAGPLFSPGHRFSKRWAVGLEPPNLRVRARALLRYQLSRRQTVAA